MKFLSANSWFTTHCTQNANAEWSAAVESLREASSLFRPLTQSGYPAHRHFCYWRRRRALDAFCAEVSASGRRDGFCHRPLRRTSYFARRDLRVSRRSTCGRLGTSPDVHHLQRSLNRRLRASPPCSALGGGNRWIVSVPFVDVFFVARDVFANRGCTRSKSPSDGCGRSDGRQTIAHYVRANFRWDINRSLWYHRRRAHRPSHLDFALSGHDRCAAPIE